MDLTTAVPRLAGAMGLSEEEVEQRLAGLTTEDAAFLDWQAKWATTRNDYQRVPDGVWYIWALLAGRGTGKTRVGAETIGRWAWLHPKTRWLVAAPTSADVRDTCFEGESGLMAVIPPELIAEGGANTRSLHEIVLKNGSIIKGIPASEPKRFRGPQFHGGWCDELAAWDAGGGEDQASWDMIQMGMRLGGREWRPRLLVSTTPMPTPLIKGLVRRKDAVITKATTFENLHNLAEPFRKQLLAYEGTNLGRQELLAEILDGEEGGVFKRRWFRKWPHDQPLPPLEMVVMSIDPAYGEMHSEVKKGEHLRDPSAVSLWGAFYHREGPGRPYTRNVILLDCWDTHDDLPSLVQKIKTERSAKYGDDANQPMIKPLFGPKAAAHVGRSTDVIIIEEKASGISLRQYLAKDGIVTFPYNPGRADKLMRGHLVSDVVKDGLVWIVESATNPGEFRTWAEPLVTQCCTYKGEGTIRHDDYYDTTTQALKYLKDTWWNVQPVAAEKLKEDYERSRPSINPYA
jgi:predicted phage terminase large subunit-like protein